jgi:hypothetical protein
MTEKLSRDDRIGIRFDDKLRRESAGYRFATVKVRGTRLRL